MKLLISVAVFFAIGFSVDFWTPFLNEEGEEFDVSQFEGLELASKFGGEKGGNGGGAWSDDCDNAGGLKTIYMECGKYVGMLRLQCNKGWKPQRGLGYGNGHGPRYHVWGHGITKVEIRAGAYVDRVTFYRGTHKYHTCGRSGGGHLYTARAPAGMTLCALKGRSGWWMDKLAAGWCQHDRDCKQTAMSCGGCDRTKGEQKCTSKITVTPQKNGKKCGPTSKTNACARDCKVGGFGGWSRCSGYKSRRSRSVITHPANGGNACPGLSEEKCCEMNGHRCTRQNAKQCCGNRCCSRWGWCGGSRDKKYDAWCGHKLSFMNHVAGFAHEMGDISVGFTGAFAAVIFLPSFAAYKFFSRQKEAAEYQSLL